MRTITVIDIDPACLELKNGGRADDAAGELIELLLTEQRFVWSEHDTLKPGEIVSAFAEFRSRYENGRDALPTDPEGSAIIQQAARSLDVEPFDGANGSLERETQLRFDALRHAISILAQMPVSERQIIHHVIRVIEDRKTQVFGLMFQTDNRFVFRLRYHTPEDLKSSTERLVSALAPRPTEQLSKLIRSAETHALAGLNGKLNIDFHQVLMKTPLGEVAQVGEVHPIGSTARLATYVASRSPQRVLLYLAILLVVADLVLRLRDPALNVEGLELTEWTTGTLGRATTAAFTAYLFAILLEYSRLRGGLRDSRAALVDWTAEESQTSEPRR